MDKVLSEMKQLLLFFEQELHHNHMIVFAS